MCSIILNGHLLASTPSCKDGHLGSAEAWQRTPWVLSESADRLLEWTLRHHDIGLYLEMAPFHFPLPSLFSSFHSNQTLNCFI